MVFMHVDVFEHVETLALVSVFKSLALRPGFAQHFILILPGG